MKFSKSKRLIDFNKRRNKTSSKYRSKAVVDQDGLRHASKKQWHRWCELKILERAGEITNLKREVTIPLVVNGMTVCSYRADHTYTTRSGEAVIEDVKGWKGGAPYQIFRIKAKLVKAIHGIEVKEV